jgi:hypothetical protein
MEFNFDNMNNTNEQPQQKDLSPDEEVIGEDELVNFEKEIDIAIEEDEESEELAEEYKNERLADWEGKSEGEKEDIIEKKKADFEENLENDLKESAESIDELEVPEDVMEEMEKLQEYKERLEKANRNIIEEREDVLGGIDIQLDGNIDISELDLGDQEKFGKILRSIRNVTQNTLDVEKIDYYLNEEDGEKGLLKTHENRLIAMEKLEYLLELIEEYEKCLEDISDIEGAKEEIQKMVNELVKIAEERPDLFEKLKKAGIVAGVIMLALAVGISAVHLIKAAGVFAAKIISSKTGITFIGGGAITVGAPGLVGGAAGALVGGGALLKIMSWLSKEENRDNLAEYICGAKIPFGKSKASDKK